MALARGQFLHLESGVTIPPMRLNANASVLCSTIESEADWLRVKKLQIGKATVYDFGINAPGGLEAGRRMAEVCMANLGHVGITPGEANVYPGPAVTVRTDHPVAACMASQYAGWEVKGEGYFAMGSGPMRAAAGREALFQEVCGPHKEAAGMAVGVLEASELPTAEVCEDIALKCEIPPEHLTLLVAPTNSQAGSVQVVARSVETALHKLHELKFDLNRIESGWGTAPLPPVAGDPLSGIGRTNDAVLYGGQVVLYVRGEDDSLVELGPKTPSSASKDHGRPFKQIFKQYDHDFYKIDPHLFSPAVVTFVNLDSGKVHSFGKLEPQVLVESFQ